MVANLGEAKVNVIIHSKRYRLLKVVMWIYSGKSIFQEIH